jgi:tetratricopeptide (TPR) repeat protein
MDVLAQEKEFPPKQSGIPQVERLYRQGLYLQTYEALRQIGPEHAFEQCADPDQRFWAARVAFQCGAPKLCWKMVRDSRRRFPAHDLTIYGFGRLMLERHGPLACLRFQQKHGDLDAGPPKIRAEWFAMRGNCLAALRDFTAAGRWIDRAMELDPGDPWIISERASILQRQDRYAEALAILNDSLATNPMDRASIQHAAELHQLLGQDAAALELLQKASGQLESAWVLMQLSALQEELGLYADARNTVEKIEPLVPLLEKSLRVWLDIRLCDLSYYCGDYQRALDLAGKTENDFFKKLAERLSQDRDSGGALVTADSLDNNPPHRLKLPVPFERQRRSTCVPATLTTLCRYWNRDVDQISIAEKICYDGTPHHKERAWAQDNDLLVREFTLTWDCGVELINRGVPFILTTTDPGSGHAQAIIGYDALRGTFLIRDPYRRNAFEFISDKALKHWQSCGPRCLVVLPKSEGHRVDGLELPEEFLYDRLFEIQLALETHNRDAAQKACDQLLASNPGHRITLYGQRCLAAYDANRSLVLSLTERLLELYPEDANLLLTKLGCLRDVTRREDRIAILRQLCQIKGTSPLFWHRLASELESDARQFPEAIRLVERAARRNFEAARPYASLANMFWQQRRFDEAYELFRFAACLDDKDEGLSRAYFSASQFFRKSDEVLGFLRERFARFGKMSAAPARTLVNCLEQVDRASEAFEVLERALTLRPQDGDLLTFAAGFFVRYQKVERGMELLRQAEPVAHRMAWLFAAAEIADVRCQREESLSYWQRMVEQDPLYLQGHRSIARLIAEREGPAKTIQYLESLTEKFPHQYELQQLLVLWEREAHVADRLPSLRRLLVIDPFDGWAHRELAAALADVGQDQEALAAARESQILEPHSVGTANITGYVHRVAGRTVEARQCYRHALSLAVDNTSAVRALLGLCRSTAERRAELKYIQEQLAAQVIFGDGLLVFHDQAVTTLEPEEVLALLREAHAARPDLWQSWSALTLHLTHMNQLEEAEKVATEALQRMPLIPRLWVDLAAVHEARQATDARIAALEGALRLSPGWGLPARLLATIHESRNDLQTAHKYLDAAVAREPRDASNHGYLAIILWKLGQRDAALERLEHAIKLNPHERSSWQILGQWGEQLSRPGLAIEKLRALTQERKGDADLWRLLASILPKDQSEEALAASERAVELEPRNPENWDVKAQRLGTLRRFKEAHAACRPEGLADIPMLRARDAWLLSLQGRLADAAAEMESVLRVDQGNYWGWQRLADWYRAMGNKAGYLKTCKHAASFWPRNPGMLEYLADARLFSGDPAERKAAKIDLRRVIEVDPDRRFAAERLFDLQIADRELDEASKTLTLIRLQGDDVRTGTMEARLFLERKQVPEAVQTLKKLAFTPGATSRDIDQAIDGRSIAGLRTSVEGAIEQELGSGQTSVAGVTIVVRRNARGKNWGRVRRIIAPLEPDSESWKAGLLALIREIAAQRNKSLLMETIKEHHDRLRAHAELWGQIGYALTHVHENRRCCEWMKDFESVRGVQPWMLLNYVSALWVTRREAEVTQVHARAIEMGARGDVLDSHVLGMALVDPDRFLGEGTLPRMLSQVNHENLIPCYKRVHSATRIAVTAARARKEKRSLKLAEIRKDWDAIWSYRGVIRHEHDERMMFKKAYRDVRRATGNPILRLLAWWRSSQI